MNNLEPRVIRGRRGTTVKRKRGRGRRRRKGGDPSGQAEFLAQGRGRSPSPYLQR